MEKDILIEMQVNHDLLMKMLTSIWWLIAAFLILRIIGWWINFHGLHEGQEKLLEEILKELKDKNKE